MENLQGADNMERAIIPHLALYVGGLHPEVKEADLFIIFSKIGHVASIRVCRDYSNISLGYAYVNFMNTADAARALQMLNHELIRGAPMRVMWSQRDPTIRKFGAGNIFIKNLDKSIDSRALNDTFSVFGNILSCKVALDHNGVSKGYGFVHFQTVESANEAIEKVHGMKIKEKLVHVEKYILRADRLKPLEENEDPFLNVYVKNFNQDITEQDLFDMFQATGKVTSVVIMKDENENSRGFGFVAFENFTSARDAVAKFNGVELSEGKCLYVRRALTKTQREHELKKIRMDFIKNTDQLHKNCNLYVKNLEESMEKSDLLREFSIFGTVTSAQVMQQNNISRGFGFVCFSNAEEASQAILGMHGRVIGSKPLYVALAERKEVRSAQMKYNKQFQPFTVPQIVINPNQNSPNGAIGYSAPANCPQAVNYPVMMNTVRQPTPSHPASQIQPQRQHQHQKQVKNQPQNHQVKKSRTTNNGHRQSTNRRSVANTPSTTPVETITNQLANLAIQSFPPLRQIRQPQVVEVVQVAEEPQTVSSVEEVDSNNNNIQVLGERLYLFVYEIYPELASKITGMILEMPTTKIKSLLENPNSLKEKIQEAYDVLEAHRVQQQGSDE